MMPDNGQRTIGDKRQMCLEHATAEFVSFVDDDDLVSPSYVSDALGSMGDDVDVIGFRLRYFEDGVQSGVAIHSYSAASVRVDFTRAQRGWRRYDRLPNHLNPVRLEIARKAGFPPLRFGEDGAYAKLLKKLKPRERYIDAPLYDYLYIANKRYEHWKPHE